MKTLKTLIIALMLTLSMQAQHSNQISLEYLSTLSYVNHNLKLAVVSDNYEAVVYYSAKALINLNDIRDGLDKIEKFDIADRAYDLDKYIFKSVKERDFESAKFYAKRAYRLNKTLINLLEHIR